MGEVLRWCGVVAHKILETAQVLGLLWDSGLSIFGFDEKRPDVLDQLSSQGPVLQSILAHRINSHALKDDLFGPASTKRGLFDNALLTTNNTITILQLDWQSIR